LTVALSTPSISGFQFTQNSASHHRSIDDLFGQKIIPLFLSSSNTSQFEELRVCVWIWGWLQIWRTDELCMLGLAWSTSQESSTA